MRDYLRTYKLITSEIEGDKEVTCVKVCPVVEMILCHNQINENEIAVIKAMKIAASKYFQEKRSVLPDDYETFAFFNPLNKKFDGFSHIDKRMTMEKIRKSVSDVVVEEIVPNKENSNPRTHYSILNAFNDLSEMNITNDDTYESEIQKYLHYKLTAKDLDLLVWWKDHKLHFPRLYNRFLQIAGMPASSASSERLLSCAGNFLTVKRNRMSNGSLRDLLFMYMN